MTAGNDGTPENDDPFAYLYRSEGGEQPDPAAGQPGVPRTSYHQVQRVGERRPQQGGYGYPPPGPVPQQPGQTGGYGYPPQAPYGQQQGQQYGGGATQQYAQAQPYDAQQVPPGGGRRGGPPQGPDAPNRKGLLIAAVAVVAAVAIGIAFAMTNGSGDKKQAQDSTSTAPTATTATAPSTQPTASAPPPPFASQKVDADTLTPAGAAHPDTQVTGANAAGGTYVAVSAQGDGVTWTVTVPKKGAYTFFISYGNAGPDATLSLAVNAKPRTDPVNLKNYGQATDWTKAWGMTTYSYVDLKKGANTLSLSCAPANTNCAVNLDQVWLKQGQVPK